ncbi:hypothetical protein [Fuerstiella marisgermanici]|uniref:Uncharacterized protein n=1 Tax=Fuerstiella marisgermanici TaxID=1891926 RepID=A0A1P8WA84_9PLAN|nr:hypothetical protein [Fuerstiella marisgermanici]APZ90972.1 hypothetical protein Fuma_00556 [Fuerstiella marisgermanici]
MFSNQTIALEHSINVTTPVASKGAHAEQRCYKFVVKTVGVAQMWRQDSQRSNNFVEVSFVKSRVRSKHSKKSVSPRWITGLRMNAAVKKDKLARVFRRHYHLSGRLMVTRTTDLSCPQS